MGYRYKNHEVSRLEAFSDAVFGFSATLLVVSLEVPADFSELLTDLEGFAAFGISFFALIMIWSVHNAFFRRYGLDDKTTMILNSCLLFVVLFYVYPLKYISHGFVSTVLGIGTFNFGINNWDQLSTLFMLYSLGFVAIFLTISLMYLNAHKKEEESSGVKSNQAREARMYFRHYMIITLVGVLSILLAWTQLGISIGLPGWIYAITGPLAYLNVYLFQKKYPNLELD